MSTFEEKIARKTEERKRERMKVEELARQREARMIPFLEQLNERYKGKATIAFDERGDILVKVEGVAEPLKIGLHDESSGYDLVCLTINGVDTSTFEPEP